MNMPSQPPRAYQWLIIIGGFALLGAMLVELLAVIGRHTGIPLPGSIELVQVLVAVSGSAALVVATINRSHAKVRLLKERLGRAGDIFGTLLSALFFMLLCIASAWIAIELWSGFEESEIWHVPYRPLRILVCIATLAVAGLFLGLSLRRRP
jgi:TRAP-type C4-dicarboxylate transport system permease small subunit